MDSASDNLLFCHNHLSIDPVILKFKRAIYFEVAPLLPVLTLLASCCKHILFSLKADLIHVVLVSYKAFVFPIL